MEGSFLWEVIEIIVVGSGGNAPAYSAILPSYRGGPLIVRLIRGSPFRAVNWQSGLFLILPPVCRKLPYCYHGYFDSPISDAHRPFLLGLVFDGELPWGEQLPICGSIVEGHFTAASA